MKRIFVVIIGICAFVYQTKAQDISNHALGLRLTGEVDFGAEISYQKALSENNRVAIGLALGDHFGNFKAIGLYQWVWNFKRRFNWYSGFGAGLGNTDNTAVFATGNLGIEYDFKAPILISLDYRPEIKIVGNSVSHTLIAFAIRYQF